MTEASDLFQRGYPFSAIVGQERLKLSLLLNAVNPAVGGVLIRGEKGTAKSTAVRALAGLLPEINVVADCQFNCDPAQPGLVCDNCRAGEEERTYRRIKVPLVNLPLNATEDRVSGGINFGRAVRSGESRLDPGLLAGANRGILYVDEVNLLDGHIVDIILDAAATGMNIVEREGISSVHPSRFILVGTMNPEEGELSPQLLDRFGLCVEVSAEKETEKRVTLMQYREDYDADPEAFNQRFSEAEVELSLLISSAIELLPQVIFPGHLRTLVAELCLKTRAAGHRADLFLEQAARALAALNGHTEVTVDDISEVANMVLLHREREGSSQPPEPQSQPENRQRSPENGEKKEEDTKPDQEGGNARASSEREEESGLEEDYSGEGRGEEDGSKNKDRNQEADSAAEDMKFGVGEMFRVKNFSSARDRVTRRGSGRRLRSRTEGKTGRYVKSTPIRGSGDIALDATLRAAAPHQKKRRKDSELKIVLKNEDIREKIREKRIGNFLVFVVDASGSMGARKRMAAAKGAIMSLLLDAYQKRDRVALITFRKEEAVISLPPTSSIDMAATLLREMPVGGRTPLSAGLVKTHEVLRNYLVREPESRPIVLIITDGRANRSINQDMKPLEEAVLLAERLSWEGRVRFIVVDTESGGLIRFGMAGQLAAALKALHLKIEDLRADTLLDIAKENVR